jgi:pimeloyl-ACP methyl ester carboxylesterase
MASGRRHLFHDLRGVSRLAIDATTGVTDLVEAMHNTIAAGPSVLGRPLAGPAALLTAPIYGSIRGITRLVGAGIDAALEQCADLVDEHAPVAEQEAVLAVLNGVLGDHLVASDNPLAIEMCIRRGGQPLALERTALAAVLPDATSKVVVLVHGCCMMDLQWHREGHDHGAALAKELGVTPVYLAYNSGRHISTNGRELAALLERLVAEWPVPVDELSIVGHSMGGLVARSACHYGEESGNAWRAKLRRLVCLGSPHHGASLERGGNWVGVLLGISRYSAPFARLANIRSAGVTDLRFGNVLDEHWAGVDRFSVHPDQRRELSLPNGVDCFFVAATASLEPGRALGGDGLISVDSALGRHARAELTLTLPESHRFIAYGANHLDLLSSGQVYGALRGWFEGSAPGNVAR